VNLPRLLPLVALILSGACVDLELSNPNAPDRERALSSPDEVAAIAAASVNKWYMAATHYQPNMMTQTTADAMTGNCCWVRFNNEEPRIPYSNNPNGGDELEARRPWEMHYAAIADASDVMFALDNGVAFPGDENATEAARAAALFTLAASHSSLALLFDLSFVITRPPPPTALPLLRGYAEMRDTALVLWDELIALTDGKNWQWDQFTLPLADGAPTAARINRLARTMAARTLMLSARTAAQNAANDWDRILEYADGGITGTGVADMDFAVVDDYQTWYDYIKGYGAYEPRFRVDQRLINRMASNIPVKFNGLANQPLPVPEDARLAIADLPCAVNPLPCTANATADYVYLGTLIGDAGRGIWMQSPFWHRRYVDNSFMVPAATNIGKPLYHVLAAENDLMIAEALVRTSGDLTRAATLVNKTRVTRGGLPGVNAAPADLLAAIEYERDVELFNTGAIALFDRRRVDGLQPGTFRHLPVPGRELQVLGIPIYTYGGVGRPDM
jgi:hypothetical protein